MSTKHIQPGAVISVTLAATVASNDLIQVGDLTGVCLQSGESGDEIEVAIEEVFEVAKFADDNMSTIGTTVYLDAANKRVTLDDDTGSNKPAGKTISVAAATATTVHLKLNA